MRLKKNRFSLAAYVIGILIIITLILGAVVASFYHETRIDINKAYAPLKTSPKVEKTNSYLKEKKPISFLIMGLDSRQNDLSGRTDALMVVTISPANKQTTMISIPRDTLIGDENQSTSALNKINAMYEQGGVASSINAVSDLVSTRIDHYIAIDFEALEKMIDSLGGISITSNIAFKIDGLEFYQGVNVLNGKEALAYTRMRYDDPQGAYGRDKRQQQVIEAVMKKTKSFKSIGAYLGIIDALGENMKTDLNWGQVKILLMNYGRNFGNVVHDSLQGESKTINNLSFQIIPDNEKERIHNILQEQLTE